MDLLFSDRDGSVTTGLCATTKELWTTLTQIYTSTSRARHTDLRRQLQTTSKGSLSCSDFLQKMRHIADELRFIGSPIPDEDIVSFILNGLGAEYNSFVVAVTTNSHHAPPTYPQIHAQLLAHEARLQGQVITPLPFVAAPAAFNTRSGPRPNYSSSRPPYPNQTRYAPRPNNTTNYTYRPNNPSPYSPAPRQQRPYIPNVPTG